MNLDMNWIIESAMLNRGECHSDGADFVPMLFLEERNGEVAIVPWLYTMDLLEAIVMPLRESGASFVASGFVADAYTYLAPEGATEGHRYVRGTAAEHFRAGDPNARECLIFTATTRDGCDAMVQVPYHYEDGNLVYEDRIERGDEVLAGIVIDALRELVKP